MTATSPDTSLRPPYSNIGKALGTDDFLLKGQLSAEERDYLERTRRVVHEEVLPVNNGFWERAEVVLGGFRRCAGTYALGDLPAESEPHERVGGVHSAGSTNSV